VPRRRPSRPVPALFHGFSVDRIADWCHVTRGTAYLYKIGQRKPSKQAVALFVLHRDRRVLTVEWKGWLLKPDSLVDPEGQETSRNLLRGYAFMLQYVRHLLAECLGAEGVDKYWKLLGASEAERSAFGAEQPGRSAERRSARK
jgi:hypothetical protein